MTFWKKYGAFEFHYFEPHEESELLMPFQDLIGLWRSKIGRHRVPSWSDFSFEDFRGWHSRIAVYDISYAPYDYSVRLAGEEYNRVFSRNMKGVDLETRTGMSQIEGLEEDFYYMTGKNMLLAMTMGLNIQESTYRRPTFLELPLTDNGLFATQAIEAVILKE